MNNLNLPEPTPDHRRQPAEPTEDGALVGLDIAAAGNLEALLPHGADLAARDLDELLRIVQHVLRFGELDRLIALPAGPAGVGRIGERFHALRLLTCSRGTGDSALAVAAELLFVASAAYEGDVRVAFTLERHQGLDGHGRPRFEVGAIALERPRDPQAVSAEEAQALLTQIRELDERALEIVTPREMAPQRMAPLLYPGAQPFPQQWGEIAGLVRLAHGRPGPQRPQHAYSGEGSSGALWANCETVEVVAWKPVRHEHAPAVGGAVVVTTRQDTRVRVDFTIVRRMAADGSSTIAYQLDGITPVETTGTEA